MWTTCSAKQFARDNAVAKCALTHITTSKPVTGFNIVADQIALSRHKCS